MEDKSKGAWIVHHSRKLQGKLAGEFKAIKFAGKAGLLLSRMSGDEEMTVALTVNLLVIVFLGGVGSLRGVLVGAVLFTALPEVLRMAPTWRLVIYGCLLLVIVIRSPEGIESLLRRLAGARGGGR